MTRRVSGLVAALVIACVVPAHAGPPTDTVRTGIDKALKILDDPNLKGEAHTAERRKLLREIANEVFDFEEMSRRALATHWRERTPEERQKFVGLFSDLLENTYFTQIDTHGSGGSVRYGAETLEGDQATVRTTIVSAKATEIPADYRLLQKDGRWWVYDVSI